MKPVENTKVFDEITIRSRWHPLGGSGLSVLMGDIIVVRIDSQRIYYEYEYGAPRGARYFKDKFTFLESTRRIV